MTKKEILKVVKQIATASLEAADNGDTASVYYYQNILLEKIKQGQFEEYYQFLLHEAPNEINETPDYLWDDVDSYGPSA